MSNDMLSKNIKSFIFFFSLVLLYIYGKGQLNHVFIRLDDWEFMLNVPPGLESHGSPWDKTLWEGRWTNFIWSKFADHLTIREVYIAFLLGYSFLCWSIAHVLTENKYLKIFTAIILFICPEMADLSLWPATLAPAFYIAGSIILLRKKFINNKYHYLLLGIGCILLYMSYAPLVEVCMILLMLTARNSRDLFFTLILIGTTYILGTLIIFSLNYFFHHHWGVVIADWRRPHPIHNLSDAIFNAKKTIHSLHEQYFLNFNYFRLFILSFAISLLISRDKKKYTLLLIAIFCTISIDFLIPFKTGVDVVQRTILWPWFAIVALLIYSLKTDLKSLKILPIPILFLYMFYNANITWNNFYLPAVSREKINEHFENMILEGGERDVYFCGDLSKTLPYSGSPYFDSYMPFALEVYKKYGVTLHRYDDCKDIKNIGKTLNTNNEVIIKIN